ncbi:hypothetical protein Patl1_12430 [Pistacia atlantica]|uniref:Uncharacterized protein n=1 Tax=Pistacia atlantica TaxID=434234 RepID=A0ACC1AXS7_9ROSI|nr:hypothetical protein Patl1_12430 [Pistacia atlantica]
MSIAESIRALFTSNISSIISPMRQRSDSPPPSQTPSSSSIDLESQEIASPHQNQRSDPPQPLQTSDRPPPLQTPSSSSMDLESQVVVAPQQNGNQFLHHWQNVFMTFCFTSAVEIAILFAQIQSQLPVSFHILSFAIFLIFSCSNCCKHH